MGHDHPLPRSLSEKAGYGDGDSPLYVAFALQRQRFLQMLTRLAPRDWDRMSRCADWTVHDVVRHVRDSALLHVAQLAGRPGPFGRTRFDPRTTPAEWLTRSSGATPAESLDELRRLVAEEAELLTGDTNDGLRLGALGRKQHRATWSTHVFWDAWIHEADIARPLGSPVLHTHVDVQIAVLYGLLIAAAPAARSGDYVDTVLALDGSPSGAYRITHDGDDVVVTAAAVADAELRGETFAVLDSLCGRGSAPPVVLDGPARVVRQLGLLRLVAT